MKTRRLVLLATLFAAVVTTAQPAQRLRDLAKYLQLTPDQIAAWKNIQEETNPKLQPLRDHARDLGQQLKAALSATSSDPTTVGKLTLELHGVREQMRAIREDARTKRLAVLTDAQKTKLANLEELMKLRRHAP
jgi:hypothetical protein